jgi:elongation factor G
MAATKTEKIRNICLLGHGGNGKTSVAEAMLYISGATDRLGKTADGTTISDFDPEEIKRKFSISASIAPLQYQDKKINIIDTPGYLDFSGEVMQGLRVAGCALIVMDAKSGVDAGCELAWDYATESTVPKAFFINKIDDENANFSATIDSMREKFGKTVCPVMIPLFENRKAIGTVNLIKNKLYAYDSDGKTAKEIPIDPKYNDTIAESRALLMESLASTSDELMEKFFAEEEFTEEEMKEALRNGINDRSIAPVMVGSALTLDGISSLLYFIANSFPNPFGKKHERDLEDEYVRIDPDGEPAVFVFKTVADPFVGKMSYFKVMNGTLKRDTVLKNLTTGENEKFAHIYTVKGKKQTEVDELCCGDIGMTAKLVNTNTNDTLGGSVEYKKIVFPTPYYGMALVPTAKGDEDKISGGIARLLEEDRTLRYENNAETKQMLVYGLGEQHLDIVMAKLKTRFGVSVRTELPKIAYRETIKKKIDAEGKHKKQSGGHGQYGHVKITFEPSDTEGLTFTESIFGGSVPKNFHPAVEKGLSDCMQKGVLAGYPMMGLKANLFDGSYHDVDSSEMAFKMAASLAYKELKNASPALLEPVGSLTVTVPDDYMGDVIGDVSKRRGRILGTSQGEKHGISIIEAEVPQAEMTNYSISLRAMTQGRGSFTYAFVRYEEVPAPLAQKIIEENAKNAD